MKVKRLRVRSLRIAAAVIAAAAMTAPASAEELSLNYERLSSIEEPIAMAVGGVTLLLNGVLDLPVIVGGDDRETDEAGLIGNVEVTALTQLPNRWRVELGYFGQRATDAGLVPGSPDRTIDHGAFAVGGAWGTVLAGHVSGIVRGQDTAPPGRRQRGARVRRCSRRGSATRVPATWVASGPGCSVQSWIPTATSTPGPCFSAHSATGTGG